MFYCTWLKDILQKTGMCRDRIEMQVLEAFAIRFPMKIAITKGIVYGIVAIFRDPGSIMEYPLPCRGSCKSRDTCREFMIHVLKAVNSPPGFHQQHMEGWWRKHTSEFRSRRAPYRNFGQRHLTFLHLYFRIVNTEITADELNSIQLHIVYTYICIDIPSSGCFVV